MYHYRYTVIIRIALMVLAQLLPAAAVVPTTFDIGVTYLPLNLLLKRGNIVHGLNKRSTFLIKLGSTKLQHVAIFLNNTLQFFIEA